MKTALPPWKPLVNVGREERIAAGVIGGCLLVSGARSASIVRLTAAALLLYRAISGNCQGYALLGWQTCSGKSCR